MQALAAGWPDDPGDPDMLPLLRDLATVEPDLQIRQAVLQALADGWPTDTGTMLVLVDRTAVSDEQVCLVAVGALAGGSSADPDSASVLRGHATADPDWATRP